jgi:inner membrane protein
LSAIKRCVGARSLREGGVFMSQNLVSGLIPRGSLGLKLLLVCLLVLVMGVPLLTVGIILSGRQARAEQVMNEIGARAGGAQVVGGPVLAVPYQVSVSNMDAQGVPHTQIVTRYYYVLAKTGSADATLRVEDRRRGIYRAAVYQANVDFHAAFDETAIADDPDRVLDWRKAQLVMFVRDARSLREITARRDDGQTVALTAAEDLSEGSDPAIYDNGSPGVRAFAMPAPSEAPSAFTVDGHMLLGGAQHFSLAAFALDTSASIKGNRSDVKVEGYYQSDEPARPIAQSFETRWRAPVSGEINQLSALVSRDMAVSFVSSDDLYKGVARSITYGMLFIGIVFLATLIFEAVSGKKAHPAQYVLVGLAQCVFYLLLLSISEIIGFTLAFAIAAGATVLLLAYYAGASARSAGVGLSALAGLAVLYGAMYVLLTLEDFALLAGSAVAFLVIAAAMIATQRIDWYGRSVGVQSE